MSVLMSKDDAKAMGLKPLTTFVQAACSRGRFGHYGHRTRASHP